jgi:hypothetical protein
MRNPVNSYLFAFYVIASFTSFAGLVVMGMALILPEPDWDRVLRGMVLFVVFALIGKFASNALEEVGEF